MARKDDKPGGLAVNRRQFLKSAGVVSAVTAAAAPPEVDAQGAAANAAGAGRSAGPPDGQRQARST